MLLSVMYHKNRVFFIRMPVLNQLGLNNIILTCNLMKKFKSHPEWRGWYIWSTVRKMGCGKSIFRSTRTCKKRAGSLHWRLGKSSMKKNYQITRTCFLAKYGWLSIYGIYFGKRYSIDYEEINFLKGDGYALNGNPDHPDGTSTDHEYFWIHEKLFDRILETDQNSHIIFEVIHKETSFS